MNAFWPAHRLSDGNQKVVRLRGRKTSTCWNCMLVVDSCCGKCHWRWCTFQRLLCGWTGSQVYCRNCWNSLSADRVCAHKTQEYYNVWDGARACRTTHCLYSKFPFTQLMQARTRSDRRPHVAQHTTVSPKARRNINARTFECDANAKALLVGMIPACRWVRRSPGRCGCRV